MARKKIVEGDLFTFQFCENSYAVGQVLSVEPFLFINIYCKEFICLPRLTDMKENEKVLLAGYVSDAGFSDKTWQKIGNRPLAEDAIFPWYVVMGPSGLVLKTFDGQIVRQASEEDKAVYGGRVISSAGVFVCAIRYYLKGGPKDWHYEQVHIDRYRAWELISKKGPGSN